MQRLLGTTGIVCSALALGFAVFVASCAKPQVSNPPPGNQCAVGLMECGQMCVDTTSDNDNCGGCGTKCTTGQTCTDSACTCSGSLALCGSSCVDTSSDPMHCGTCTNICTGGQVCSQSRCGTTCAAGLMNCSSACVNVMTSSLNCGSCGHACPAGQGCSNGNCGCATGQTLCGANCVDTTTSAANCGSCAHACAATQVCSNSMCQCPAGQMMCSNGTCAVTCSGAGGSGGGAGGAAGGSTGTGGTGGASTRACAPASVDVLSDFEEGSGVLINQGTPPRTGWWYVYADPTAGGAQTPAASTGPVAVAASGDTAMCNKFALHSTATNHAMYTGFGATFSPMPAPSMIKNAYNLSSWDGITFRIKAGSGTPKMYFEVLTKETQGTDSGGTAATTTIDLFNTRGQMLSNITTSYQTVYVPFGGLIPRWMPAPGAAQSCPAAGGGIPKCQAPTFNPASALGIQFSLYPDPGFPTDSGSYDVWVDDVALYHRSASTPDLPTAPNTSVAHAFPRNAALPNCTKPTGADGIFIVNAYNQWKARFVVAAGSGFRVQRPENNNDTVSEGIAYGMLIAVYMGDKALFDGLWNYWRTGTGCAVSSPGCLMTWNNTGGQGSATDADEDAAFAMMEASKQWTGNPAGDSVSYSTNAMNLIHAVLAADMGTGAPFVFGGSNFKSGNTVNNASYYAPAWYREFAKFDTANTAAWNTLASNVYTQLANANAISSQGLISAWCNQNCTASATPTAATDNLYQYDSHRIPWRIGIDYCWNGTAAAKTYVDKTSAFFSGQGNTGVGRIFDLYQTNGTVASGAAPNSSSLIGTAAIGAMANASFATFRDDAYRLVLDQASRGTLAPADNAGKTPYSYFNATVGMLMLLTMTGNFNAF